MSASNIRVNMEVFKPHVTKNDFMGSKLQHKEGDVVLATSVNNQVHGQVMGNSSSFVTVITLHSDGVM